MLKLDTIWQKKTTWCRGITKVLTNLPRAKWKGIGNPLTNILLWAQQKCEMSWVQGTSWTAWAPLKHVWWRLCTFEIPMKYELSALYMWSSQQVDHQLKAKQTWFYSSHCLVVYLLLIHCLEMDLPWKFVHILYCLIKISVLFNLLCALVLFQKPGSQLCFSFFLISKNQWSI